jgi:hypothetical protein
VTRLGSEIWAITHDDEILRRSGTSTAHLLAMRSNRPLFIARRTNHEHFETVAPIVLQKNSRWWRRLSETVRPFPSLVQFDTCCHSRVIGVLFLGSAFRWPVSALSTTLNTTERIRSQKSENYPEVNPRFPGQVEKEKNKYLVWAVNLLTGSIHTDPIVLNLTTV